MSDFTCCKRVFMFVIHLRRIIRRISVVDTWFSIKEALIYQGNRLLESVTNTNTIQM